MDNLLNWTLWSIPMDVPLRVDLLYVSSTAACVRRVEHYVYTQTGGVCYVVLLIADEHVQKAGV